MLVNTSAQMIAIFLVVVMGRTFKVYSLSNFFLKFFFFFNVDHFLRSLNWIYYSIASVLSFGFLDVRHLES